MKKIGIIGGIGPESTLDYYRGIIDACRARGKGMATPTIIVYSGDLAEALALMERRDQAGLCDWLLDKVVALHAAGAEFAAIASNTPHMVFDRVAARSPLPLLSIVEATCAKACELGVRRLGLLGTLFTMQADFFRRPFAARGMEVVVPVPEDQEYIHGKLFTEIELGIIREETRAGLMAVVQRMREREGIDALILGCTELPLILPAAGHGIPFLNTTAIHVESIVRYCLGEDSTGGSP